MKAAAAAPAPRGSGEAAGAAAWLPDSPTLPALRRASLACEGCALYRKASQTVFGAGPAPARLMLVGEQPGDEEDRAGQPFIGPAGRLLDAALEQAGIARDEAYVSNVVKHFKWVPRGKRRMHQKPERREIAACLPWLRQELRLVRPQVLVCLGATAAQALLGPQFRVMAERGRRVESELARSLAPHVVATVHPSAILRVPGQEQRRAARQAFVADLAYAASLFD
jgi:uracil-DNA glycosylase